MTGTELNVGVNGFGRIGRLFTRAALLKKTLKIVAINDPFMTAPYMAYLLNHDSVHGKFQLSVTVNGSDELLVDGQTIKVFGFRDAAEIPWAATTLNLWRKLQECLLAQRKLMLT